jgi:fructose-bisphosphate aldolase, class II
MSSLLQYINQAETDHIALGHFNVSTIEACWAIIDTAKKLNQPVVIGVSEGERDFIGIKVIAATIKAIRDDYQHPIFLNADHTYSLDRIKEVVAAGYDSVIFDGAKLSLEENIIQTKAVVDYVKSTAPHMLVEAELGYIGTSSALLDKLPEGASLTLDAMPTGEDARHFVQSTGVDLLAPAVGNIHGMLKDIPNPKLHIDRIREIRQQGGVPLVLHGDSGISNEDFIQAIQAGISMIHINTEIRQAWRRALDTVFTESPDEVAPYKLLTPAQLAIAQVVESRLNLYTGKSQ